MNQPNNRDNMKQKTDFNNWSISYLRDIYQCGKCKKRNTIVFSSNNIVLQQQKREKLYQNCLYCGNPNYV
jgi:DNA-directed RNA polymerase subunit RPC12/RpoP